MSFPLKFSGTKDRQHYVFRSYLLPWATDEQIWVLRQGKLYPANVSKVAVEKHFYKLQELTEEDITLIRQAGIDGAPKYVQERCETLLYNFTMLFKIRKLIDPPDPKMSSMLSWIDERIINHEEDLHCDVEAALLPALADMLAGRTTFYSDKDRAQEFLHAISFQYMRTKKRREAFRALTNIPVAGAEMKRFGNLFTIILTLRLADSLYRDREQFKIVLIDNHSDVSFVTGDQPIINLHATLGPSVPEKLEFFYPLSPQRAMLLLERTSEHATEVDADEVRHFNSLIVQNSQEQVFSNCHRCLESLRGVS